MSSNSVRPYNPFFPNASPEEAAKEFFATMSQRRSVRMFSDRPVSQESIEWCIRTAGAAPSGANKQPWRFVAINDPVIKKMIRLSAEIEEREFYARRAPEEWLADLRPLGTTPEKPFLETAPWVIAVFKLMRTDAEEGVYYVNESVGIACGFLLAAIHQAGLVALTHTPNPMGFLSRVLDRPAHERPFLLVPVGYPAADCVVPDINRKPLNEILVLNRGSSSNGFRADVARDPGVT
jgi:hypothetical protein